MGRNFNKHLGIRYFKHLMGVHPDSALHLPPVLTHAVPEASDVRRGGITRNILRTNMELIRLLYNYMYALFHGRKERMGLLGRGSKLGIHIKPGFTLDLKLCVIIMS